MNSILVKYGTSSIIDPTTNTIRLQTLQRHVHEMLTLHCKPVIVSSGAIALGKLDKNERRPNSALTPVELQSYATIGQPKLMSIYDNLFNGQPISQILLTDETLQRQNDVRALLEYQVNQRIIPIINYNDGTDFKGVRTENDEFAATLADYLGIKTVINFGNEHGFLDENQQVIPFVHEIDHSLEHLCHTSHGPGSGGQLAKLAAAKRIMNFGGTMIQAKYNSSLMEVLYEDSQKTIYQKRK